jgi:hypothetical protein
MAGAIHPKFCADFQQLALVRAAVNPATSQSRHHVVGNARATVQRETKTEKEIE